MNERFLGILALVLGCSASCRPEYGVVAFRCVESDSQCPAGYTCVSSLCVENGAAVPTLLGNDVSDDETAFSARTSGNNTLVCWLLAPSEPQPGVSGALVASTGQVLEFDRPLYSPSIDESVVVARVGGDCIIRGAETLVGIARVSGPLHYQFRSFNVAIDSGLATPLQDPPGVFDTGPHNFRGALVGNDIWFAYSHWRSNGDLREFVDTVTVHPDDTVTSVATMVSMFAQTDQILGTELLAGDGGAWLTVLEGSGQGLVTWLTAPDAPASWFPDAIATYDAVFPLAVHGTDLALAYRVGAGHWALGWLDATGHTSLGPTFDMDPALVRPGGLVHGDQLVIAGASRPGVVQTWTVPWGSQTTLSSGATITKVSQLSVRRIQAVCTAGVIQLVWTERVPPASSTEAAHVSVFAINAGSCN